VNVRRVLAGRGFEAGRFFRGAVGVRVARGACGLFGGRGFAAGA